MVGGTAWLGWRSAHNRCVPTCRYNSSIINLQGGNIGAQQARQTHVTDTVARSLPTNHCGPLRKPSELKPGCGCPPGAPCGPNRPLWPPQQMLAQFNAGKLSPPAPCPPPGAPCGPEAWGSRIHSCMKETEARRTLAAASTTGVGARDGAGTAGCIRRSSLHSGPHIWPGSGNKAQQNIPAVHPLRMQRHRAPATVLKHGHEAHRWLRHSLRM